MMTNGDKVMNDGMVTKKKRNQNNDEEWRQNEDVGRKDGV